MTITTTKFAILVAFLAAMTETTLSCSSNYPDKYIPMAMPIDINSGLPVGGLGRKRREVTVEAAGTAEAAADAETDGVEPGGAIKQGHLAETVNDCVTDCVTQVEAVLQTNKVSADLNFQCADLCRISMNRWSQSIAFIVQHI